MSEYPILVFMALLILCYGLFSKRAERSVVTAPMVFVLIGILVSFFDFKLFEAGPKAGFVRPLAEFTLLLVLFVDASTINLRRLNADKFLPIRMLGIGLPITMVFGSLAAIWLFPEEPVVVMILLALMLSPTDAALGQAVVTSAHVPLRIRQTINVESGLNDGIALPPILICIAFLSDSNGQTIDTRYWGMFTLKQFVLGPAAGAAVGWLGGWLVDKSSKKGWMNHTFQMLASLAIAILAYSVAEYFHGNGFIAAYFAGMLLGTHTESIRERIREFGEAESQVMILFIFLLFGMILIPFSYPFWDWRALVYAVLSLSLIRMLPVYLSLMGSGLETRAVWFMGWFGPRGIASVLYLILAIIALGTDGYDRLISVVSLTVLLSVFAHGISAVPYSGIFTSHSAK
jgi:NhaP-type Na+/H+ or K+/H+ antiporter